MRKSERLFQLVTLLQGRRTTITARAFGEELGVAVRTVYRDIQALVLSGVPIDGEAGVGYRLRAGFDLSPLMFQPEEVTALLVGSRMVQAWTDPALAQAAKQAEAKILAVLTPAEMIGGRKKIQSTSFSSNCAPSRASRATFLVAPQR